MLSVERLKELDKWLLATNTRLTQVNGQRKYGGPPEGKRDFNSRPCYTLDRLLLDPPAARP